MSMNIYALDTGALGTSSSGASFLVEDFVPSPDPQDCTALITYGESYDKLNMLACVEWVINGTRIEFSAPLGASLMVGEQMRLGHRGDDGEVVCSRSVDGPHQPFQHGEDRYHTDDAPHARIYKNGELFVDHWGEYREVGNPWVDGSTLYFECLSRSETAPNGWELWRMDLETREKSFWMRGANPCVHDGRLILSVWNTVTNRFDIGITSLNDI